MYAVEIETDIKDRFIEVPDYQSFKNKHTKVIFMTDNNISSPASLSEDIDLMEEVFSDAQNLHLDKNINIEQVMQDMNDGLC